MCYLDKSLGGCHITGMFNLVSIAAGIVALPVMLLGLVPLLGWLNYLVIPIAIIGLVVGMMSRGTAGRNLNLIVLLIGFARLSLGGFIF